MAIRTLLCRKLPFNLFKQSHKTFCSTNATHQFASLLENKIYDGVHNCLQHERYFYYNLKTIPLQFFQLSVRYYAKSRDKKKGDKGQKKTIQVNNEVLQEVINVESMQEQMQGIIDKMKEDLIKNVSLRSSSGSLETLPITFEGKDYVLQDVAQVVRKNPKTVVINMVAFPQVIPTVIQAISKSGMNLNPQQDGTTIYVPIAKITKEHRETLSKNAKALFIRCRDNIKDVQNKYIKTVRNKEQDGLAKDIGFQITEYITQVGAEYISRAEKMLQVKQQELLYE